MCGEAPGPLMPRGHKERSERAGVLGAWPTPEAQVLSWASCVQQASSCRATFLRGGDGALTSRVMATVLRWGLTAHPSLPRTAGVPGVPA